MKIKFILTFIFIQTLCISSSDAQNFFPLPPGFDNTVRSVFYDSTTNILYAGGQIQHLANGIPMRGISQWNGTSWDSLGSEFYGLCLAITKYNGLIYVGGSCSIKDSTGIYIPTCYGSWNGTNWIVPPGGGANSAIWDFYVNGNDLYVGGAFDTINGMPAQGIARFDGTSWHSYPSLNSSYHYVNAIAIYNNELYIGGNFSSGVGKKDILKFDGTNWVSVGGGLSGGGSIIDGMVVFQGELYIAGLFHTAWGDPGNCIAKWNGTTWSSVGSGALSGQIFGITAFKNEIYVGGTFSSIGGVASTYVAKWNGNSWQGLGSSVNGTIISFASNSNDLYMGGGFYTVNTDTMMMITRYSPPLGVEENTWHTSGITISPNPNNGNFSITSLFYPIESIRLFDLSGRVIFLKHKILENTFECKLNTPDGIYIAEVFVNGNVYRKKIAVTR